MTPSTEKPIGPHTVPAAHEKSSAHAELFSCNAGLRLFAVPHPLPRTISMAPLPKGGWHGKAVTGGYIFPAAPAGHAGPALQSAALSGRADRVVRPYKPFRRGRRPRRPAFTSCHVIRRAGCPHPAARTMGDSVAVFRRFLTKRLVKGRALCYTLLEKQKCGSSRVRQHPRACAGVYTTYTTAKWPHRMEYYTPYRPFL